MPHSFSDRFACSRLKQFCSSRLLGRIFLVFLLSGLSGAAAQLGSVTSYGFVAAVAAEEGSISKDDFEGYAEGSSVDRLQGWKAVEGATGVVRNDRTAGGNALQFNSGSVVKTATSQSSGDVSWIDMRIKVRPMGEEPPLKADTSGAFYFTYGGQLRVNNGRVWQDADTGRVNLNDWQRIVTKMDYGASPQTWSIWLNGRAVGTNLRFANRVDGFQKVTFDNQSGANSYLDNLTIGTSKPNMAPVDKVVELAPSREPEASRENSPSRSITEKRPAVRPEVSRAEETENTVTAARSSETVSEAAVSQDEEAKKTSAGPYPVLHPATFFLVPLVAIAVLFWQRKSSRPKCPFRTQAIVFSIVSLLAVALFFAFPSRDSGTGLPLFLMAGGLAAYMGGLGFWLMRRDYPEEISILFRGSLFVGVAGLLLIAVGAAVKPEIGVGLLATGFFLGLVGCWMFADSGIRGARLFLAGIIASVAAPAVILQQMQLAGWIFLVSYCLLPLCFVLRDARRKLKKAEQIRQFEKKGELKRPVIEAEPEVGEEEVVVVRREKKPKRSRKGRSRKSTARPVIISREQEAEGEEDAPVFGEGVLATEPGRQGNVRIDPWTGAAVQEGEESESEESDSVQEEDDVVFEEMEPFGDEEEELFPEMESFEDEEVGEFSEEDSPDSEGGEKERNDERSR